MEFKNDPLGFAINDFIENASTTSIDVKCDKLEDDTLPLPFLFRTFEEMPELEKKAMSLCSGEILDVGAGAGPHAEFLISKGINVTAIESSKGAADYLKSLGIKTFEQDILSFNAGSYDTILLLMNGLGIAGKTNQLSVFLNHLKSLLSVDGFILIESTDISYLYAQDDGSIIVDLNDENPLDFKYQLSYKGVSSVWFDWCFVNFENLKLIAEQLDMACSLEFETETQSYLAKLSRR